MKDSEVEWLGEVPEHWEVLKLKFLQQFPVIEKVLYNQSPRKTASVQNHAAETVPLTQTGLPAVAEDLVYPCAAGACPAVF
ncbi:MAG: hypothetical protein R3E95_12950 [Thiolinea sp.]